MKFATGFLVGAIFTAATFDSFWPLLEALRGEVLEDLCGRWDD